MAKYLKKLLSYCFILVCALVVVSCTNGGNTTDPGEEPHVHVECPKCGLCMAEDCDGSQSLICEGHEDEPVHTHVACPECGLCTSKDCDGNASEKCAGHNVEPSIKDDYECITIEEAIALATAAGDSGTADKYYIYGKVQKVTDGMYGEMIIEDETGELYVYGVYSADGSTRYDAMEEKPVAGDEVVLYGMLKTYQGEPELDRGYLQAFKHVDVEIDITDYKEYSINSVRDLEAGEKVKVSGVVAQITYAYGYNANGFYLVDETGSIYVYGTEATAQVKVGNTITIVGEKTYYVLASEQALAEKHGYQGCCQIQNPQIIENDKLVSDFNKSWIEETTIKEMLATPLSNNITTNIYKVNAIVNKVEGTGFVNYYFNDLDGVTGSYTYTSCSGGDFKWLDQYDGKICTVYLSAINCKSTAGGCIYRFIPVQVIDEGYEFDMSGAAEFALTYYAVDQFVEVYVSDPAATLVSAASNDYLGFEGVEISYSSSDESVVYFEQNTPGEIIFHTKDAGSAVITITAMHNGIEASVEVDITVRVAATYDTITVEEAINSQDGTEVYLKGIVVSSLVNQYGFYLQDETGIIAVVGNQSDVALLSSGDEVIIKGIKSHKIKEGYTGKGQINVYNAEILVNLYGDHEYDTSKFITDKDVKYLYDLDYNEDHSTEVYIMEGIVVVEGTNYYTSIKLASLDGSVKLTLYSASADQYAFLKPYDGKTVTVEIAPCNWNSKTYYAACVLAVYDGDTKIINELNLSK